MSKLNVDTIEPEGASTTLTLGASGDTVTIPSGATIANSGTASGFGLFSSYAIIADQKAQNTDGGTATSGAWRERDLQTEIADPDSIVSISSNQFTLAAGSYLIKWYTGARKVMAHQTRLYDVTGTAEVEVGTSEQSHTDAPESSYKSMGAARVSPGSSNVYSIEHQVNTTKATEGWGTAANFGVEQYTTVEIYKEA